MGSIYDQGPKAHPTIFGCSCLHLTLVHVAIGKIYALISGPFDTPYEGGFFLFFLRVPPDYPMSPPRVKLLTTDQVHRQAPNMAPLVGPQLWLRNSAPSFFVYLAICS